MKELGYLLELDELIKLFFIDIAKSDKKKASIKFYRISDNYNDPRNLIVINIYRLGIDNPDIARVY